MRRRASRPVVVAVAASLVLAACGGENGGGDDGGPSKDDYAAQADAICERANKQLDEVPSSANLTPAHAAGAERMAEIDRAAIRRLRALRPPSEDRRTINRMLAKFARAAFQLGNYARANRERDRRAAALASSQVTTALGDAQKIAREYGLEACARFGLP